MAKKKQKFFDFTPKEVALFSKLDTPEKIQNYINDIPINFELDGDTYLSPREVIKRNVAHCAEGAILAAVILWYHGQEPLLMDLKTINDVDHIVALFKGDGYWGAISKTNHAVLRYREPIYKTLRELALSYFHEYFKENGKKTLRSFSAPFDLSKIKNKSWMVSAENLSELIDALDDSKHFPLLNKKQITKLRKADLIEIEAGNLVEWHIK